MKKIILFLVFIPWQIVFAQSRFEKVIGASMDDNGASFESTSTGDYLMGGSTFSYSTDRQGLVIKTDSAGQLRWAKIYYKGTFCRISQAFELLDGNYMFSGYVVDSLHQETDVMLTKTDTSGAVIWSKLYGTVGNDYIPSLHAIIEMPDSGFAFAAGCDTNFSGREDLAIIRTDKNGDTLWTKFYHAIYRDQASSIAATHDGGFIISGRTNSFDNFIMDMFLVKTDSAGEIQWAQRYGGSVWDEATGAIQTSDGGFAVCGSERSFSVDGEYDALVFKTDSIGTVEWTTAIGDSLDDALYSIIETNDGGFACAGITESYFNHQMRSSGNLDSDTTEILAFKLNALGDTTWCYVYGSEKIEEGYSIRQHPDKGYMIAGLTRSFSGNNTSDVFAVKTDSMGVSCTSSPITPLVYHPVLISDTISFLQFSPIIYRNYFPNVTDVAIDDSALCYQYTSMQQLQNDAHFTTSPNPFNYSFRIKAEDKGDLRDCTYNIIDILGRDITDQFVVTVTNASVGFTRKPVLKTGVYMLVVSDGNKVRQTVKLVAQ